MTMSFCLHSLRHSTIHTNIRSVAQTRIGLKSCLENQSPAALGRRGLHVAVVGSGPAGFFTASRLIKTKGVRVDMFERLPGPYGLVRYGVAPDHTSIKNMENKFQATAEQKNVFRLICNVTVGRDLSLSMLRQAYDAVVLCYGSQGERRLGIPGESDATNVFSSREFVSWYNGHPDYTRIDVDLACTDTAVVVGQGNVALDVARTLLMPVDELAKTDMPTYAVEALSKSRIRRVHVVGRRGPMHVAFTSKELRTMSAVSGLALRLDPNWLSENLALYKNVLAQMPPRKRMMDLLLKTAQRDHNATSSDAKEWNLDFLMSPRRILKEPIKDASQKQHVSGVEFELNNLVGEDFAHQQLVGTGKMRQIPAGLVVTCVGYLNKPLSGENVQWDDRNGLIPNKNGRVAGESGLYVSGWIKTGPRGDIAATMHGAHETADLILHECASKPTKTDPYEDVNRHLLNSGIRPITFSDWQIIDRIERERGASHGKPREKITSIQEALALLQSS